jgi:hypothetical protein
MECSENKARQVRAFCLVAVFPAVRIGESGGVLRNKSRSILSESGNRRCGRKGTESHELLR